VPEAVIVRLPNWLGDTVMAVPALRVLRAACPGAPLAVAGPWISVLRGQGLADVLVEYSRHWRARLRAADQARTLRAEVAVILPNSFESALAARYWGARRRIGFAANARSWLLTDRLPLPEPRLHQADEYMRLAEVVTGPAGDDGVPRLEPPSPDAPEFTAAHALLASERLEDRRPLVGLHLGAAFGPSKLWPTEHLRDLVSLLGRRGVCPVLLGSPDDRGLSDALQAATGVPSLVGRDRIEMLPALLAALDVLVCGDTGVGHLAAALGTHVVALFGPTDPRLSQPRGQVHVVRHPPPCAPCFYRTCPIDHVCMRSITPAEVAAQVDALASAGARAR
jgi:heptosyltransferase-2